MNYSKFATVSELKEKLTEIKTDSKIEKSGIPMMYEGDSLYIKDDTSNTLVIGCTGSGKTQTTVLPVLKLAIKAGESFILNDINGEILGVLKEDLNKEKYNTIVINLADPSNSDGFNPLEVPYKLYKEGKKDQAIDFLENVGHYLFANEKIDLNVDPFWQNSAVSLFTGLVLYEFENNDKLVTLSDIGLLMNDLTKVENYLKSDNKSSIIDTYLSGVIFAPSETKGSIISVFKQYIRLFITREGLTKIMTKNTFDMGSIQKDKTAVFIISDYKISSKKLIPLLFDQISNYSLLFGDKARRLNIIIDEFANMIPFYDMNTTLSVARSHNIRFIMIVQNLSQIREVYGNENANMIIDNCGNIIYLLSIETSTLEEISKLCGNLITKEELRNLKQFEAIILMPRINPIRTKLLPYHKINW